MTNLLLKPKNLNDFKGKVNVKKNLKVFIEAAKKRKSILDHCLFYGPAGVGKTTLANIIANELKTNIKIIQGPEIQTKADIINILFSIKDNDVLFIDEAHAINYQCFDLFYSMMDDFKINICVGKEFNSKITTLNLPKFTLICATTKLGNLPNAFQDRFGIIIELNEYSEKEIFDILKDFVNKNNFSIDENDLKLIASFSKGIPRIAKRTLLRVIDYKLVNNKSITLILKEIGLYDFGLNLNDINYLKIIYERKIVGLKTFSQLLDCDEKTIIEKIEPFLIRKNLILKTNKGRELTNSGLIYIEKILV